MEMQWSLVEFLVHLGSRLPIFVIGVLGIVVALGWRRRAPRAALLAAAGSAVVLLAVLLSFAWSAFGFPFVVRQMRDGFAAVRWLSAGSQFVLNTVLAVGVGLLLAAVFAGRAAPRSQPRRDDDADDDFRPRPRHRGEDIAEGRPNG